MAQDRQESTSSLFDESATQRLLSVIGLSGFAVAQPLYQLLARYPEFLVAHRVRGGDLLCLAAVLSFGVALLLALPGLVPGGRWRRTAAVLHVVAIALLVALWWAQTIKHSPLSPWPLAAGVSLALTGLTAWLYVRRRGFRRLTALLALPAVVFPAVFLLGNPVRDLWREAETGAGSVLSAGVDIPVVLVVLDELPLTSLLDSNEALDTRRFPNIAALAADGVWYRNATTVAESTSYAVPAILTGRYPFAPTLLPTARHYPQSLFTLLGQDYALHVWETVTELCPRDLCQASAAPHDRWGRRGRLLADVAALFVHRVVPEGTFPALPEIGDRWSGFWQNDVPATTGKARRQQRRDRRRRPREAFEAFVADLDKYPAATVHYLHVLLPHAPWRYIPSGHSYPPRRNTGARRDPETGDFSWVGSRWEVAQGLQRHLLQVGFVDTLLGRLRDRLVAVGLYDRALIVLVADHGAAFRRGHSTRHTGPDGETLADLANVPLIVKYPAGALRGVDDGNVETIDILPTVLTTLGAASLPGTLDGWPLQESARRAGKRLYPSWGPGSARGVGREFTVAHLAGRRQALRFQEEFFGSGEWSRVFAMGPHGALVGRAANEIGPAEEVEVELEAPEALLQVDLAARALPLSIAGTLSLPASAAKRSAWLAVLVNERVAAVTRVVEHEGRQVFTALLEPRFLTAGDNTVRVVALARTAAGD